MQNLLKGQAEFEAETLETGVKAYHGYLQTCSMKESGFMLNAMQAARAAMWDHSISRPFLFSLSEDLSSCTLDIGGEPHYFDSVSETDYPEDNAAHRALFTLPPIRESAETMPAVQDLPPQQVVTGDKEVDAVLWLRQVISTGQPRPIAAAMEAAKKIATPMKDLEKRYSDYLHTAHQGHFFATFAAIGFGNLEGLAKRSIDTLRLKIEAEGRFGGDSIWLDTPAEQFCEMALKRCKGFKSYIDFGKPAAHKRFRKHAELMPHTLDDCLHEIAYWNDLQRLRSATGECGDGQHQAIAREWFVVGLLAEIKPRDKAEALRTLDYAEYAEGIQHDELIKIFRNLLE
ncbi:hypothetical protein [Pseudomonas syringae]|uniref:hypothetical protein n=1 Tax=Pseudomonas syringae TaxID=317 RepID=UPI000B14C212|nr:hypothetical protein [Pseudomonas syringae]